MNIRTEYDVWHRQMGEGEVEISTLAHPWHITVANLLAPDLQASRILEIGCGRGDFALWMKRRFPHAQVTAIDFSETAIEIAQQRAAQLGVDVNFAVGDATALRFENNSFDFIVSCECLEHIPQPEAMAQQMFRVLVPRGRFILTTENYFNGMVLAWLNSWLRNVPYDSGSGVQPHENFFLFWKVKRLLENSGLIVNHLESNHFQWLLLPRVAPAKLCTENIFNPFLKRIARPFGRHFTFCGFRPQ